MEEKIRIHSLLILNYSNSYVNQSENKFIYTVYKAEQLNTFSVFDFISLKNRSRKTGVTNDINNGSIIIKMSQ